MLHGLCKLPTKHISMRKQHTAILSAILCTDQRVNGRNFYVQQPDTASGILWLICLGRGMLQCKKDVECAAELAAIAKLKSSRWVRFTSGVE